MASSEAVAILRIEDERGHARFIERALRQAHVSHDIMVIYDGQEALDYLLKQGAYAEAQHEGPRLVPLDIQRPSLDGVQVLTRLKVDERTKDVPVIMMSSTASVEEMEPCAALECAVQLVKPVDSTAFFEAVRQIGVGVAVESAS